jgi:hypothetical protein
MHGITGLADILLIAEEVSPTDLTSPLGCL